MSHQRQQLQGPSAISFCSSSSSSYLLLPLLLDPILNLHNILEVQAEEVVTWRGVGWLLEPIR